MVIYHLDAGGGWRDAVCPGSLASPVLNCIASHARPSAYYCPSPTGAWFGTLTDPPKSTRKERASGSAQSWVSEDDGVLVENLGCYREKWMVLFISFPSLDLLSICDCYNSLLRNKHLIRPLLPTCSENKREDWIESKLSTATGRIEKSETQENTFIHSFIHFTDISYASSCARDYSGGCTYSGEQQSLTFFVHIETLFH